MINPAQGLKTKVCKKHNQPIVQFQQETPLCPTCLIQLPGMISYEEYIKQFEDIQHQDNQENKKQMNLLLSICNSLESYIGKFDKQLNVIIQVVKARINALKATKEKFQSQIQKSCFQSMLLTQLKDEFQKGQQENQLVREEIKNLLLNQQQDINKIIGLLKEQDQDQECIEITPISKKVKIQEVEVGLQKKNQLFQYELLGESKILENCDDFALNKENKILALSCKNDIILYHFINEVISNEILRLIHHTKKIFCLCFMKQSNFLVSGSKDKSIIIWDLDKKNQSYIYQILKEHNDEINCILINQKENQMISGSDDETIKIWRKFANGWSCQKSIDIGYKVFLLEFSNHLENKFLAASDEEISILVRQQHDQQWIIEQTINLSELGYSICCIMKDQFFLEPKKYKLEVGYFDSLKKQFCRKQSQIEIQTSSDVVEFVFAKQQSILILVGESFLQVYYLNQDGDYQTIQTIELEFNISCYEISEDGQYILIRNEFQDTIEIRKLKYL